MHTNYFVEPLAYQKIDESRAEAARQRLLRAAEQPRRHGAGRGLLGLLRDLRALLVGQAG